MLPFLIVEAVWSAPPLCLGPGRAHWKVRSFCRFDALAALPATPAYKARPVKAVSGTQARRQPVCSTQCFNPPEVTVGGQSVGGLCLVALKRRCQGRVLPGCFFWSWTTRKKSQSDPQGRPASSSRMRTLTPELTISLPAADSHPRLESRDSESAWNHDACSFPEI